MKSIEPIGEVHICYAADEHYAPYLKVSLNALLSNRNRELTYDIVILCQKVSKDTKSDLLSLFDKESDVSIRFFEVEGDELLHKYKTTSYLTVASLFRLLILSEMFSKFDRVLYLDTDTICETDISKLFYEDMEGQPIAAVEETGFRQLSFSKKAVFIDGKYPYNVDNYRTDALNMKHPEMYFNAGVLLFDVNRCRETVSFANALELLQEKQYFFNDQDVLNMLFDGKVHMLGIEWNYQNGAIALVNKRPNLYRNLYADVLKIEPFIIHYVSFRKPWNEDVALCEHYRHYIK